MNLLKMQRGIQNDLLRYVFNILRKQKCPQIVTYTTSMNIDIFTNNLLQRQRERINNSYIQSGWSSMNHIAKTEAKTKDLTSLTDEELDKLVQILVSKNKDKQIDKIITECLSSRRLLSDMILKIMLKHYSNTGKPDMIVTIQKYCAKLLPNMFRRNGDFIHYVARAQCFKGNSEKGLSLLKQGFIKHSNLRSFYKNIFKELIQDSVLNRSEASLVIFKKYVLEFSLNLEEHYPLVCMWHICWLSSWYSDQVLCDELWDTSEQLRGIISEKVTVLSVSALKADYNEDAVVRLLQTLLKYQMMDEYSKVLQVLFAHKLRCKDLRGCTEIIRNCEVLGLSLPRGQQGRFITMMIGDKSAETQEKPQNPSRNFPLKF